MGCFTPEALPVLSALAARLRRVRPLVRLGAHRDDAEPRVRLRRHQPGPHGRQDEDVHLARPSSALLGQHGLGWSIYGYDAEPLTRHNFPDTVSAAASHFGLFTDFQAAAAAGTLPAFTFLEPSWASTGNSQHPNYDVALGEQLIHDVYEALRGRPGWTQTLLVLTYDEHGGCYDHVPPPWGATPPDDTAGEFGFDFDRFGVRVPTVLISPLIAPGTVYRVPAGSTPLDHTSILKTIEQRWYAAVADRAGRRRPRLRGRADA